MQYLIGSRAVLMPVWRRWHISASLPNGRDVVSHTALVYGISASGKIMTVYPANFAPAEVAHDVPILARL
jgi:cytochrome oxidase Cu insertion factor (SCO1/SenC/PrrC family)